VSPARAFLAAEAVVVLAVVLALVLASGCGPVSEVPEPDRFEVVAVEAPSVPYNGYLPLLVLRDAADGRCWLVVDRTAPAGPVPCSAPSAAPAAALMPEAP
jgi:hypothetical protein